MDYESIKFEYIQHFHKEEGCGHDIKIPNSDVFIILEEFPYLEIYDKEYSDKLGSGYFYVRKVGEMTAEHSMTYYKDMYNLIRLDYDALYQRVQDITLEF
jgi:hypothetical protein